MPLKLRQRPHLFSYDAAARWAQENGGPDALRKALANRVFRDRISIDIAERWLASTALQQADAREDEILKLNRRSTLAAERSALYAKLSAVIALVSAVVAVAAYLATRP